LRAPVDWASKEALTSNKNSRTAIVCRTDFINLLDLLGAWSQRLKPFWIINLCGTAKAVP